MAVNVLGRIDNFSLHFIATSRINDHWQDVVLRDKLGGTHGNRPGSDQSGGVGECEGPEHQHILATGPNSLVPGAYSVSVAV